MKKSVLCILTLCVVLSTPVVAPSGGFPEGRASEEGGEIENLTICLEPRAQICTQDYRPVCAQMVDGTTKTYSNGCMACTDPVVTGYREGACQWQESDPESMIQDVKPEKS